LHFKHLSWLQLRYRTHQLALAIAHQGEAPLQQVLGGKGPQQALGLL
jgi:hypothetical protein